jgi:glutamine amidotransferase
VTPDSPPLRSPNGDARAASGRPHAGLDVAILDYGCGNLHSLAKALRAGGAAPRVVGDAAQAATAGAVVLPGVGAFGAAAERLGRGIAALRDALAGGLPCLGICLGMQLLFADSEEGAGRGLATLAGSVRRLRAPRLPHMGWNDVVAARPDPLLAGVEPLVAYFAHSFVAAPADPAAVVAWTTHGGDRFPAVVRRGNSWGVQFHPEKSGAAGLRLLRNFLELAS